MEAIGIPKLTPEQVEELCEIAEKATRQYILSKIPRRGIAALNITVDMKGVKPLAVDVDTELSLLPEMKGHDIKRLTDQATEQAFASIEKRLREIACKSTK